MREWLVRYIEHAFADVTLDGGTTLYEAAYLSDYGNDPRELTRADTAERTDWRRVPFDDLFARTDAISFMNSAGRKFYSPAILRAFLIEGVRDCLMYDSFLSDLAGYVHAKKGYDVPFSRLYNATQRSAFARFCKFGAYNAPSEFGRDDLLRILNRIRKLEPPQRDCRPG